VVEPGESESPRSSRIGSRAGLIILALLAVVIAVRLVTKWLKWLLILVAIAGLAYAILGRAGEPRQD